MRYKLTPSLSYIIGLYSKSKSSKGIGVKGRAALIFAKEVLDKNVVEKGKILYGKDEVYFYNSKLKRFFEKILKEVPDRFIFINDYSANYFAGMFDSVGEIKDDKVYLGRYTIRDSIALQKLGFINEKQKGKIRLKGREVKFLNFIRNYAKLKKNEIEDMLEKVKI